MLLSKLLRSTKVKKIYGYYKDKRIDYITLSSRDKHSNMLYVAQRGGVFDGHNFLEEAVLNGAVALVVERFNSNFTNIVQIVVESTREAICSLASEFYGNPKDKLRFVGVTGTNGKTSCTMFFASILKVQKIRYAVVGTLGIQTENEVIKSNLTTPDPLFFHKMLAEFVAKGVEVVIMEVSAHAIFHKKVSNIIFDVGIFTNITQDHLDFFKTMNNYSKAKLSWLLSQKVKACAINADDGYGRKILLHNKFGLSYGINAQCDIRANNINLRDNGSSFSVNILGKTAQINTALVGEFNIYNLLAVIAGAVALGVPIKSIVAGVTQCKAPTGRYNVLTNNGKTVIIDFAHTPDGLQKVLEASRRVCEKKLYVVFGCGGDRDKTKRPIMGRIGTELADFAIITSDNPRFERPEDILKEIERGIKTDNYYKVPNRAEAIKKVLEIMDSGDVAVICGKGGEDYQDINGVKHPYSDLSEVQKRFNK